MKYFLIILIGMGSFIGFSNAVYAHDEGHGPKLSDTGKYGGIVSSVVNKENAKMGGKAPLLYKAELVRSTDGTLRLYIYDKKMSILKDKKFSSEAKGSLAFKTKGKWENIAFTLESKDNVYIGKMPKPKSKPYNIDIVLKDGEMDLLMAFDNLD